MIKIFKNFDVYLEHLKNEFDKVPVTKEEKLNEMLFYYGECFQELNEQGELYAFHKEEKYKRHMKEIEKNIEDIKNRILNL